MRKRVTKKFIIGLIRDRLEVDDTCLIEGQTHVTREVCIFCKNSVELNPIRLETLEAHTLEDIYEVLISDGYH